MTAQLPHSPAGPTPSGFRDGLHGRSPCSPRLRRDVNFNRFARQAATRLAWTFRIPLQDDALVPWLTGEACATNGDALARWVRTQCGDPDITLHLRSAELIAALKERLQRLLVTIEEAPSC